MEQDVIDGYIEALKGYRAFSPHVVAHRALPERSGSYSEPSTPFPDEIRAILEKMGIESLYSHQVEAIDSIRAGNHTVAATPTASGKTMIYNLPVIEGILNNPQSRALYLFPLKALAQDQLKGLKKMFELLEGRIRPTADIYDGDTNSYRRGKIRNKPPNIVLSNPEMLHLSILPYHAKWAEFLSNLKYVIVDEVHTCRGVMGSHMAWVFRRLLRICSLYGSSPVFIFCSATIRNPEELAGKLTGLEVAAVKTNGAPASGKHFLMLNTPEGASQAAIALLHAALHRGLRTIVYTQSRKMTELISLWASNRAGKFSEKISAYRAGFLPEERREIEAKLSSGELLAVVSTSALEMGIDIGELDLCILVGYPGTVMATWQRAGRVGRKGRNSAVVLIGHEDALDQYMMNNPEAFFAMEPETAVINPFNTVIMKKHLECAAAELPLRGGEPFTSFGPVSKAVFELENRGTLLRSEDGELVFASRKYPQRKVSLRGTGESIDIVDLKTEKVIGGLDRMRAFGEAYPGAVYIHRGVHYVVKELDLEKKTAYVEEARVHYFTRARSHKDTEILEVMDQATVWSTRVCLGKLRVTETVTGYEKRLIKGQKLLGVFALDLPPLVFETEGIWIEIPHGVQRRIEDNQMHFMGGIHAMEHAAIGILPIMVMTDRNDLGGISMPFHDQVGKAAVFVYDGFPGGVGLCRRAFELAEKLLLKTMEVIAGCECDTGCPACVHSPKCGSGNRPIDKGTALALLELIKQGEGAVTTPFALPEREGDVSAGDVMESPALFDFTDEKSVSAVRTISKNRRYGVLDLETRRSAQDVGGWGNAHSMGISCVVVYDSATDDYVEYLGEEISQLVEHLQKFDFLVGFNIWKFDYAVLSGSHPFNFHSLPTLDILKDIHSRLGYRLSLDHLAQNTLNTKKSADGLMALQWWKEGKIREIIEYCRQDVAVTRDLYRYGLENKFLLFQNKAGMKVRIPVNW